MTAGKNYNTVTKCLRPVNTTGAAIAAGSSVAAGQTRYVTFVHLSRVQGATGIGAKVYLCSTSTAAKASTDTLASAAAKMVLILGSASAPGNMSIPDRINTKNPLFTIAASRFLTVREASTVGKGNAQVAVFIQYYDQ
jgi:hypothetical protein